MTLLMFRVEPASTWNVLELLPRLNVRLVAIVLFARISSVPALIVVFAEVAPSALAPLIARLPPLMIVPPV
jgi:hypothetical protein